MERRRRLGEHTKGPSDRDIGIDAKVAFLRAPGAYPGPPDRVETIETHMSWVFLAGDSAYKLKKPVRRSYLDFSTLPARRRNCSEEIRLNRRLAPDVYLDKQPLTLAAGGGLELGGSGAVVDWLVHMRRLPAGRMLDRLLREGAVDSAELRKLAAVLARFYGRAPRIPWPPGAYARHLRRGLEISGAALLHPRYGLPADRIRGILAAQRQFLAHRASLLEERARTGRVVDGHGDLRPEHICLERVPKIIDCLEFNREMRQADAADELAFLALECERLGREDFGPALLELYARLSGDTPAASLVAFYKSCRACLRAKLALWHLDEEKVSQPEKWPALAGQYVELAEKYAYP
ncbi:MAG: hypothetical protein H6R10_639 [Rhodocyclaceae bacterium]|nr:hypothetical protein [Rhodocyclaceae bacterium]